MPLLSGLATGVKQETNPSCAAKTRVSLAVNAPTVVRQELDGLQSLRRPEPPFDRIEHQVAHVRAANAGAGDRFPGDDLAIVGVDDEGTADDLAIPAGELEAVGTPAQV